MLSLRVVKSSWVYMIGKGNLTLSTPMKKPRRPTGSKHRDPLKGGYRGYTGVLQGYYRDMVMWAKSIGAPKWTCFAVGYSCRYGALGAFPRGMGSYFPTSVQLPLQVLHVIWAYTCTYEVGFSFRFPVHALRFLWDSAEGFILGA